MQEHDLKKNICIAVLPLQILSEDQKVETFCQGLVMDLIGDLSRFRSFRIIAHETTETLHPNEKPDSPLLNGLHLDYLVKGMVRNQNEKMMFNLQLINVPQNRLVWAEKFNGAFDELFRIQESIVEKIVMTLQHFVDYDLLSEIRKKPLTNLSVYECWLKGYQELKKGKVEADEQARVYFRQAMEMDPNYPRAYTGMSLSFFNEWSCQLWTRWEVSRTGAFEWAQKALELDEWDHVSNAILGRVYLYNGEYEKAEHLLRKSLRINSNDPETLIPICVGLTYLGYPKEANALYDRARRLNPTDHFMSDACGAFIQFELGSFEEAVDLAKQHERGKGWVDFPAYVAAAHFLRGDHEKMRSHWNIFLEEFSEKINGGKPADTRTAVQWMINVNPYRNETRLKPFWEYISQTDPEELVVARSQEDHDYQNFFTHEGDLWEVAFDGNRVQIPDLKGYHDLSRLLAKPHTPVHCTELMEAKTIQKGEPVFDEKAKKTFQKRILQLQEEIENAEAAMDDERLAVFQEEYEQLLEHLSQSIGKGGKARKLDDTIEKCRTAVTWRIRNAIKKISVAHPALGKHLNLSIKTGVFCEYAPEHQMEWTI